MALISAKYRVKDSFFQIYLPSCVAAVTGYVILTYYFGAYGTATGNIFAYGLFSLLLLIFLSRKKWVHKMV
jgi:hypothetical protein